MKIENLIANPQIDQIFTFPCNKSLNRILVMDTRYYIVIIDKIKNLNY